MCNDTRYFSSKVIRGAGGEFGGGGGRGGWRTSNHKLSQAGVEACNSPGLLARIQYLPSSKIRLGAGGGGGGGGGGGDGGGWGGMGGGEKKGGRVSKKSSEKTTHTLENCVQARLPALCIHPGM